MALNNVLTPNIIPQEIDEAIVGFFQQYTDSTDAAYIMAGSIIQTAMAQNLHPMDVIDQFRKMPKGQLNEYLVMFLNLNRYGSSLLGLSNQPVPNKYVSRMILS